MFKIKPICLSLSFVAGMGIAGTSATIQSGSTTVAGAQEAAVKSTHTSVEIAVEDISVADANVLVLQNGEALFSGPTDREGDTGVFWIDVKQPFDVLVDEAMSADGYQTVAQHFIWDNAKLSPSLLDALQVTFNVPEYRDLLINSFPDAGIFFSDGESGFWSGATADASFGQALRVAALGSRVNIEAYLRYHGQSADSSSTMGLIFRTSQDMALPQDGLNLIFDLGVYNYDNLYLTEAYFGQDSKGVGFSTQIAGSTTSTAEDGDGSGGSGSGSLASSMSLASSHTQGSGSAPSPRAMAFAQTVSILVKMEGVLRAGDNVILLSFTTKNLPGSGGVGPLFASSAPAPGLQSPSANQGNCAIVPPSCSAACDPEKPPNGCKPTEWVSGPIESNKLKKIGPKVCNPHPSGGGVGGSGTNGAGVTGGVEAGGKTFGAQVGGTKYGETSSHASPSSCHCEQVYRCRAKKTTKWEVWKMGFNFLWTEYDCYPKLKKTTCEDEFFTSGICKIPGCN